MLRRALLASLAIHILVLLAWRAVVIPPLADSAPHSKAIAIRLARTAPEGGKPVVREHAVASRTPPVSATRRVVVSDRPATPVAVASSPVLPSAAAVQPSAAESKPEAAGESSTVRSEMPAVVREPPNVDGLRQYRLALAREARRFKRYPAVARARGWEGQVGVLVTLLPGGELPDISLAQSSGYEALDAQALEMIGQAVRTATLPDSMKGKAFRLTLPVSYSLEE